MRRYSIPENYEFDSDRDLFEDIFRSTHLSVTAPRVAIVKALSKEIKPISIASLHEILVKDLPKINSTSVYRTLEALVKSGVVSRINTGKAHSSYEMIDGRKHHHHVICNKCGDMEDVETCPVRSNIELYENHTKKFKVIQSHSLEFFGLCTKCA